MEGPKGQKEASEITERLVTAGICYHPKAEEGKRKKKKTNKKAMLLDPSSICHCHCRDSLLLPEPPTRTWVQCCNSCHPLSRSSSGPLPHNVCRIWYKFSYHLPFCAWGDFSDTIMTCYKASHITHCNVRLCLTFPYHILKDKKDYKCL